MSNKRICKRCGHDVPANATVCSHCGKKYSDSIVKHNNPINARLVAIAVIVVALVIVIMIIFGKNSADNTDYYDEYYEPDYENEQVIEEEEYTEAATYSEEASNYYIDDDEYGFFDVQEDEYYNLNRYVSNFTEMGFDEFQKGDYPADELLWFAYQNIWFNHEESIEWAEDLYFDEMYECNTRIPKDKLDSILEWFFDVSVNDLDDLDDVDNYYDGYYYSCETGGNLLGGFALLNSIEKEGSVYSCMFDIYRGDEMQLNYDDYGLSYSEAESKYGEPYAYCYLKIRTKDLDDRSKYELLSYEACWE